MRCARCGYISFDYLDRCKSCGEDMVQAKIKLNIYTKQPELDTGDEGFLINRVSDKSMDKSSAAQQIQGQSSTEDQLKQSGNKGTSFDFGEDKIS
jgi:hypothetical protein